MEETKGKPVCSRKYLSSLWKTRNLLTGLVLTIVQLALKQRPPTGHIQEVFSRLITPALPKQ